MEVMLDCVTYDILNPRYYSKQSRDGPPFPPYDCTRLSTGLPYVIVQKGVICHCRAHKGFLHTGCNNLSVTALALYSLARIPGSTIYFKRVHFEDVMIFEFSSHLKLSSYAVLNTICSGFVSHQWSNSA